MKKTLMIIGAGVMQEPAIKIAQEMGLRTIVTDFNPNAIGLQIADIPIVMSTKDIEGTVRVAKSYSEYFKIDGVITVGTDASMTVAAVANALGLPGLKFEVAERATNKVKMRATFKKHKVPSPDFQGVWTIEEAVRGARRIGYPLVIKPSDNMGARGVKKINNENELFTAFSEAKSASPSGELIIEQYMSGPELSIDMLVWDNKPLIWGVADRIITNEPYFIEIGHTMPSQLDKKIIDEAIAVTLKGAHALGINTGAVKGDIKITPDGIKIGELAARLSGGYMSAYTFPYSTDENIIKYAIEIALGIKPYIRKFNYKRFAIERAIMCPPGMVLKIEGIDKALNIDNIKNIFLNVEIGSIISQPRCNLDKAGNIIAIGNTLEEAETSVKEALKNINIAVGPLPEITDDQIKHTARRKLYGICAVCKNCNGVICAGQMPGIGSVGTGQTFINNYESLRKINIKQRVIHSINEINTSIKFLDYTLSSPIMIAPVTGMETNLKGCISELDYARIVIGGACKSGTIAFVGDGASTNKYKIIFQAINEFNGWAIPIFKPRNYDRELLERFDAAKKYGVKTVGMDIDALMFTTMLLRGKNTRSRNIEELKYLIKKSELNFILKGIMSKEDALAAVETGASAIIVSNHGGRTIDNLPATIDVLPEIIEAVTPSKIPVLIDGGFRSGEDIFKALALGASAVLIGRPLIFYAIGGGEAGVKLYINNLKKQLEKTMILTGCENINSIKNNNLYYSKK
ncbi:MAG TPA: alpha-hydroxy-acid oxidizing protein [bacterium]|nr:alpha-hydroxy-acid oxidizing protein [bacterium]HPP87544.1 alpha-hydroxy-acid oxidizing protein [bacterium]